jgi:proline iminopeptidase
MLLALIMAAATLAADETSFDVARPDVTLHVREVGKGAPVVVLSGGPGLSASYMEPVTAELARDHRCIVPDQRGTGGSKLAKIDATTANLAAYVADLEALREKLALPKLAILGHSWGGMLAMAYAAEHPDRVLRLVLVGSGGPSSAFFRYFPDNIQMRLWPEDLKMAAEAQSAPDPGMAMLLARMPGYFYSHEEGVKLRATMDPKIITPGIAETVLGALANGYDLAPKLRAVHAPVLVIQGRQDPVGESTAIEICDAIAGSKVVWLERCGHFPWIEAHDLFFEQVRAFLDAK